MTDKYLNLVNAKIYVIVSESDGGVTFRLARGGKPAYLGRSEFDKRFLLLSDPEAPAPVGQVLDQPAKVGSVIFRAGVSHDTVIRAAQRAFATDGKESPADQIIGRIEGLFPNWRSYRDLVDCIECTLHDLRSATPIKEDAKGGDGEVERLRAAGEAIANFRIEWIAAARPPVHQNPMTGKAWVDSFDDAVKHMKAQASDAKSVSLTEVITTTVRSDRSADLRAALAATATEGDQ